MRIRVIPTVRATNILMYKHVKTVVLSGLMSALIETCRWARTTVARKRDMCWKWPLGRAHSRMPEQVEPFGSMIGYTGCKGRSSDAGSDPGREEARLADQEDLAPPAEPLRRPDVLTASSFCTRRREVVDPSATASATYYPPTVRLARLQSKKWAISTTVGPCTTWI